MKSYKRYNISKPRNSKRFVVTRVQIVNGIPSICDLKHFAKKLDAEKFVKQLELADRKHVCVADDDEVGFNLVTGEKDFFCKICQKKMYSVKVKK